MNRSLRIACLVPLLLAACGGGTNADGGLTPSSSDPRCSALCTIKVPTLDGAFDVCSTDSASSCVDLCETRIKGVSSICADCLLENASFKSGGGLGGVECLGNQCTIHGYAGSCTYDMTNPAAEDACYRQVSPRRTVDCSTSFQSVSKCAGICT